MTGNERQMLARCTDEAAERGVVTDAVTDESPTTTDEDDVDLSAKSKSTTPVTLAAGKVSNASSPLAATMKLKHADINPLWTH